MSKELELLRKLVDVLNLAESGKPLIHCQGQAMDGYTQLANYRSIAKQAKQLIEQKEEEK